MCELFALIYIYIQVSEKDTWVYVLTNKRILAASIYLNGVESIGWERIERFTIKDENFIIEADVYLPGFAGVFVTNMQDSEIIEKELEKVMPFIWKEREKLLQERIRFLSPADEIRKFKELCDDGIITEEEFQQKKKKLLDL